MMNRKPNGRSASKFGAGIKYFFHTTVIWLSAMLNADAPLSVTRVIVTCSMHAQGFCDVVQSI